MEDQNKTVITDIDIPFFRLVMILVKVALAAIPAMIIVWIIMAVFMMFFSSLFGGFGTMWMHSGRPL